MPTSSIFLFEIFCIVIVKWEPHLPIASKTLGTLNKIAHDRQELGEGRVQVYETDQTFYITSI